MVRPQAAYASLASWRKLAVACCFVAGTPAREGTSWYDTAAHHLRDARRRRCTNRRCLVSTGARGAHIVEFRIE